MGEVRALGLRIPVEWVGLVRVGMRATGLLASSTLDSLPESSVSPLLDEEEEEEEDEELEEDEEV